MTVMNQTFYFSLNVVSGFGGNKKR